MQFLAFLRDSYREAKSGWMLQVMLALSALLILLVASVGFRPVTLADELNLSFRLMNRFMADNPSIGRPAFGVENFTQTNPDEPWKSDFGFDYVVKCPTPADLKKAREAGLPVNHTQVEDFLRDALSYIETIEVTDSLPPEAAAHLAVAGTALAPAQPWQPSEARYAVRTRGTKVEDRLAWRHRASILFAFDLPFVMSLREGLYLMQKWLVNNIGGWVALAVSVIITAGFIPNMLAKGSLDLLASKPIGRSTLLVYKYIGGLTFMFLLTAFTVLGVWVAIGVRSGIWSTNFLAIIPILTLYFAVLYAVSTLAAVLTRNTLVAILLTGLAWGVFYGIGLVNDKIASHTATEQPEPDNRRGRNQPQPPRDPDAPLWGFIPKSVFPVFTTLHAVTPRTFDLDSRLGRLIAEGVLTRNELKEAGYDKPPRETWGGMIGVSLGFIAVMLALACWRFGTRDY
jgi:ABC-type transport system involved in multi-copper enzyme maturation permease subunit